jgi:hypothetical protein
MLRFVKNLWLSESAIMKKITGFYLLFILALLMTACGASPQPSAMPEATPSSPAEEIVLTWHREGGIAGFCDNLSVSNTGTVVASTCKGNRDEEIGRSQLTPEQLEKLETWVENYASFHYQQKDAATADAMSLQIAFTGKSDRPATEQEKKAMLDWMNALFSSVAIAPTS